MGWCCPLHGVAGPDEVTGVKPPAGRWAGHLRDAQRPAAASQTPTAAAFHARSSPPDAGAGPHAARAHRPGARGLAWARTPTLPAGTRAHVCIRDPHSCHSRHTRTDAESPLQGPPRGVTGTPSEPDVPRRGGSPARSALAEAPAGACSHRRALCPCSFPVAEANRGNGGGPHPEDAGPGAGEGTGLGPGRAGPRGVRRFALQGGCACAVTLLIRTHFYRFGPRAVLGGRHSSAPSFA